MTPIPELLTWLQTLDSRNSVAIDEGGLTLVEIETHSNNTRTTGTYLEIGGEPEDTDCPDCNVTR